MRSNYPLGKVNSVSNSSANNYSKLGTSNSYGYNGTVFEPNDSVKGDLARIMMYSIVRYSSNTSGYSKYPSYQWNRSTEGAVMYAGSLNDYYGFTLYSVKLLTYWNNLDKPDDWERTVNQRIYSHQSNKNPFVDHPEYANTLWGWVSGATTYSDSSVGTVTLSKSSASIEEGQSTTISATSSNSSTISWTSSDTGVATVNPTSSNSGASVTISAVAAGTATITASATINNQTVSSSCSVTVTSSGGSGGDPVAGDSSAVSLSAGTYSGGTITWKTADNITTVTQMQGNGGTAVNSTYISAPRLYKGHILKFETSGSNKIASISLKYDGSNKGDSMTAGIAISGDIVTNNTSAVSRTWDTADGGTHVVGSVSSTGLSTIYIQNVASGSNVQFRPTSITVTYVGEAPAQKTLLSISTSGQTTSYTVGATFSYDGTCTAAYSDGTAQVTPTVDSSNVNMAAAGTYTVSLSYTDAYGTASTSYTITVSAAPSGFTAKSGIWRLVTSDSEIVSGSIIVIACSSKGKTAGDISSQIMGTITSTFTSTPYNQVTLGNNTVQLMVGGSSGNWTLSNTSGQLLGATAEKKLAWGSGTTKWSITISSNNATIQNNTSSFGKFLYNVNSPRFTTYSSAESSSMLLPQIYKFDEVETYAKEFVESGLCGNNDNTSASSSTWSTLKTKYLALGSASQTTLKNGTANQSDTKYIGKCLAKYDRVIYLHGSDTTNFPNFMTRGGGNSSNVIKANNSTRNTALIAIAISTIMIGLGCVVYSIKIKKRNNI